MTRFALLGGCILALSLSAFAEDKKDVPKELTPFQGSWKVVEASREGKPAPKDMFPDLTFTFEGNKVTVKEGKREPDAGSYSVDAKKEPATIDLVTPKGDKVFGIYKFDKDDKLTIAFGKGQDTNRPKAFDDKDAVILVMEKLKK